MSIHNKDIRIIVVEDEKNLLKVVMYELEFYHFNVRGVPDAKTLYEELEREPADIIVLDLMLPDEDGIKIARQLRENLDIGIIILTAKRRTEDRIIGFESGADIYFSKPTDFRELVAAIKRLANRVIKCAVASKWRFRDESSILTTPNNINIQLTHHQCILIKLLFSVPRNYSVSKTEILAALGHPNETSSYPRLEVMISRLRAKVQKADPANPLPIVARHGRGYAFLLEEAS